MLNPFFIQGTSTEQGLIQDLINEQLKMYGIEVYYMPRQIVSKGKIIKDVIYSKFKNAFPIEAYLASYDGFDSNSIVMSKFGVRITDEMNLIISKERFDMYIGELMKVIPDAAGTSRPYEGDLIYVPLSDSIMEIKYVENRKPFFQLQKNYVYELRCELFEYEDEEISTSIKELDDNFKDIGYGALLTLAELGSTATGTATTTTGGIQYVTPISGGYRYSSTPTMVVSSPISGIKGRIVGVMTSAQRLTSGKSLDIVYIEDGGSNYLYQRPPSVSFFGGGGYGASVQVGIATAGSVRNVILDYAGQGYSEEPTVTFSGPGGIGQTAIGKAFLDGQGGISTIRIINAGYGYTQSPSVTISAGATVASGNFIIGEEVFANPSGASGLVKSWEPLTRQLNVTGMGTDFQIGDIVVGAASSATYIIQNSAEFELVNPYDSNDEIQEESDNILDFTEVNPFGEV
jgi:hypothetical protein